VAYVFDGPSSMSSSFFVVILTATATDTFTV